MGLGKTRKGMENQKNLSRAWKHVNRVYSDKEENPAVTTDKRQYVSVSQKSTSTPQKSTSNTSQPIRTMETQETLIPKNSQTLICSVEDSHVNLFLLLEKGRVSKIQEVLFSMKYAESWNPKDLDFCFSKMSKDCSQQTMEGVSQQSSHRWMNWGMMSNGRFLTQNILECHRTGKECSLSGILEEKVANQYFLSEKQVEKLNKIMNATKQPQSILTIVSQKLKPGGGE